MLEHGIGELATHQPGNEIEMVIVRQDEGSLPAAPRLADDLLGEQLVDPPVALLPRPMGAVVEHRRLGQVPEVVLDEPEQRVGDGVVVEVVGQPRRIDPAHLEPGAVGGLDHHRLPTAA